MLGRAKAIEERMSALETRFGITIRMPKVFRRPSDWVDLDEEQQRKLLVAAGIDPDRDRAIFVISTPSLYGADGERLDDATIAENERKCASGKLRFACQRWRDW